MLKISPKGRTKGTPKSTKTVNTFENFHLRCSLVCSLVESKEKCGKTVIRGCPATLKT